MTKIAGRTPAYCSSCFQARPEMRYIDFEASWDGPAIDGMSHKIAIDDLVLCEQCLNEAFVLLDPEGQVAEIERLSGEVEALRRKLLRRDRTITGYNMTNNELVDIGREAGALTKTGGRPVVSGVDEEAKGEINYRIRNRKLNKKDHKLQKREKALRERE